MTTFVKIFGLWRSGTNYLSWFLQANFENITVLQQIGGWKHGPPVITLLPRYWWPPGGPSSLRDEIMRAASAVNIDEIEKAADSGGLVTVCVVRDPATWLPAVKQYVRVAGLRGGLSRDPVKLLELWERRTCEYLDVASQSRGIVLRLEDLQRRPTVVATTLAVRFGLQGIGEVRTTSMQMRRGGDGWRPDDLEDSQPLCLRPRCSSVVLRRLDPDLLGELGYLSSR